jgi:hypothetical protein
MRKICWAPTEQKALSHLNQIWNRFGALSFFVTFNPQDEQPNCAFWKLFWRNNGNIFPVRLNVLRLWQRTLLLAPVVCKRSSIFFTENALGWDMKTMKPKPGLYDGTCNAFYGDWGPTNASISCGPTNFLKFDEKLVGDEKVKHQEDMKNFVDPTISTSHLWSSDWCAQSIGNNIVPDCSSNIFYVYLYPLALEC